MNEKEYVIVRNLSMVRAALSVMRDLMPDEEYGVSYDEKIQITKPLSEIEIKLFEMLKAQGWHYV